MNLRKFIVENGMGIDQHGQSATDASVKAVKDAIARPCLTGIGQVLGLKDWNAVYIDVLVACPYPEQVDEAAVRQALPVGNVKVKIMPGGMIAQGVQSSRWGDHSDEMYIANAAVTVWVDVDQVHLPASR